MSILPEPLKTCERLGYAIFTRGDYNLNIICVRNDLAPEPNAFDDFITVTYRVQNKWHSIWYPATTDPGRYWLMHPMRVEGTAILAPGQYRGSHQIGLHKGKPGLVQVGEVEIFRDNNRDEHLDPIGETRRGYYGINVHRAGENSVKVDKWSAGCMVFKSSYHCDELMTLCDQSSELYGDRFTLTLLKASQLNGGR